MASRTRLAALERPVIWRGLVDKALAMSSVVSLCRKKQKIGATVNDVAGRDLV
jgi:hypothetical protein